VEKDIAEDVAEDNVQEDNVQEDVQENVQEDNVVEYDEQAGRLTEPTWELESTSH
jgi:hypothetical protein